VFFIFVCVGVNALIFVITQVPERRGVSLEKMEEDIETCATYNFRKASRVN